MKPVARRPRAVLPTHRHTALAIVLAWVICVLLGRLIVTPPRPAVAASGESDAACSAARVAPLG